MNKTRNTNPTGNLTKRFLIASNVLAFATVVVLLFLQFAIPSKEMAYVNSGLLLEKYEAMIEAKKDYKKKADLWQANIDTLEMELMNEIKKYEKERNSMTDKEKGLTEELLGNKQQQFLQYQDAVKKKAQDEDQKLTGTVVNQVNAYLKEYGKKHNYLIVFGTTGAGNILYADDMLDITENVLTGLNNAYNEGE